MGTDSERSRYTDLVEEIGLPFLGLRVCPDTQQLEIEHLTRSAAALIGPLARSKTPIPLRHALPALEADLGPWLKEAALGGRGPDELRTTRWTDRSGMVTEYEVCAYPLGDRRLGVTLVECLPPPHRVLARRAALLRDTTAVLRRCDPAGGPTALMEALLPQLNRAWPDHVGARVWFDRHSVGTPRFQATESRLLSAFETSHGHRGRLEVMRKAGSPARDGAVFGVDDQLLLDAFAEALRRELEHLAERRELELAKVRLELSLGTAKQGHWTWSPDGDELELDARSAEIVGAGGEPRTGRLEALLEQLGPASRGLLLEEMRAALEPHRDGTFAVELDIVTRNGDQRSILVAGVLVEPEHSGIPRRFVGILADRTRLRRLEEEHRALASRLRQLRQQIGHVAHETRNVVTVICGFSELMTMSSDDPHQVEAAERILESSDRLRKAIDQLDYYRKSEGGARLLDPREVVRELTSVGRHVLGPETALTLELDSSRELLLTRRDLERIILKLLAAGRTAVGDAGRLLLSTSDLDLASPVSLLTGVLSAGPYVQLVLRSADGSLAAEAARAAVAGWLGADDEEPRRELAESEVSPARLAVALGGGLDVRAEPGRGASLVVILPAPKHSPAPPDR